MPTVFHLDNSQLILNFFKGIFTQRGYEYMTGGSIEELLEAIKIKKIDLVITATELVNGSGEKLLDILNKNYPKLPVIVMTSSDTLELREKMFSLGAIDIISKAESKTRLVKEIELLTASFMLYENLRKARIAVLDDSPTAQKVIRKIFELYQINNVDYFLLASEFSKSRVAYDVYLVDVVLEDASGERVIEEVREKNRNAVIIAVSSIDHYKAISTILQIGADDYIIKPYNESILMARISSNFRTYLLNQELRNKNIELEKKDKIISDDLKRAKEIQHNFLSFDKSSFGDIDISLCYRPLIEVGGDIYDVYRLQEGYYRIFIADATGHGVQAALVTMMIKNEYDRLKSVMSKPNEILCDLNTYFFKKYYSLSILFTACIIDLDLKNGFVRFSSAGHPYPYMVSGGELITLKLSGTIIGVMENIKCDLLEKPFAPGDRVILYSDGLFEDLEKRINNPDVAVLEDVFKKHVSLDTATFTKNVLNEILTVTENDIQDDVTFMVIQRT